jgi:predicted NBD/HSP70 family sugar kinase
MKRSKTAAGRVLANHTGVSVYIQHDISAWTMAESLFGASAGRGTSFRW